MTTPNIYPRTHIPSRLVRTLFPKYSLPLFPQSIDITFTFAYNPNLYSSWYCLERSFLPRSLEGPHLPLPDSRDLPLFNNSKPFVCTSIRAIASWLLIAMEGLKSSVCLLQGSMRPDQFSRQFSGIFCQPAQKVCPLKMNQFQLGQK